MATYTSSTITFNITVDHGRDMTFEYIVAQMQKQDSSRIYYVINSSLLMCVHSLDELPTGYELNECGKYDQGIDFYSVDKYQTATHQLENIWVFRKDAAERMVGKSLDGEIKEVIDA